MKKTLTTFFLLLPFLTFAQSPGYQGKHFILSYSPDIAITNYFNGILPIIPYEEADGLYLRHNILAEYVLSRNMSIGAEYSFLNQAAYTYTSDGSGTSYFLNIKSGSIGLDLIYYTGNNNPIAPVGNYFKVKLFLENYSAAASAFPGNSVPSSVQTPVTGQTFGIGIGFGHNHIIANRVLITYGISMDWHVDNTQNEVELNQRVYEHLLGAYIFPSLRFGVGGLLF